MDTNTTSREMNTTTINAIRNVAEQMFPSGNYSLQVRRNDRWATVMFNITKERAERDASLYKNARVVAQA
jgi:hypothetical protein